MSEDDKNTLDPFALDFESRPANERATATPPNTSMPSLHGSDVDWEDEYAGQLGYADEVGGENPIAEDLTPAHVIFDDSVQVAEGPGIADGEVRVLSEGDSVELNGHIVGESEKKEEILQDLPQNPPADIPPSSGSANPEIPQFPEFSGTGQLGALCSPDITGARGDESSDEVSRSQTPPANLVIRQPFRLETKWRPIQAPSPNNYTGDAMFVCDPEFQDPMVDPGDETSMKGRNKVVTNGSPGDPPEMEVELVMAAQGLLEQEIMQAEDNAETSSPSAEYRRRIFERHYAVESRRRIVESQAVQEWEYWARQPENSDKDCRKIGDEMLKAVQATLTEMLGELIGEDARRLNTEADERQAKRKVEDATEILSGQEFEGQEGQQMVLAGWSKQDTAGKEYSDRDAELKCLSSETVAATINKLEKKIKTLEQRSKELVDVLGTRLRELINERRMKLALEVSVKELRETHKNYDLAKSKQIAALQKDLDMIKERLKKKEEDLEHYEEDNRYLRDAASLKVDDERIRKDLQNKDAQIDRMTAQMRERLKERDKHVSQIDTLLLRINTLEEKVEHSTSAGDIIRNLNEDIKGLTVTIREQSDEITKLRYQRDVSAALHRLEQKDDLKSNAQVLEETRHERDISNERVKELLKAAQDKNDRIKLLRQEYTAIVSKVEDLESEKKSLQQKLEVSDHDLEHLSKKWEAEKISLSDEITQLTTSISEAEAFSAKAGEGHNEFEQPREPIVADRESLAKNLQDSIAKNDHNDAECETEKAILQAEIERLKKALKVIKARVEEISMHNRNWKKNYTKLKEVTDKENDDLRKELKEQVTKLFEVSEDFNKLTNAYDDLLVQANLDRVKHAEALLDQEAQYLLEKQAAEKEFTDQAMEIATKKGALEIEITSWMKQTLDLTNERNAHVTKLRTMKRELEDVRQNLKNCHADRLKITSDLDRCREKGHKLKQDLDGLKDYIRKEGLRDPKQVLSGAHGSPMTLPDQMLPAEVPPTRLLASPTPLDSSESERSYSGPQPVQESVTFAIIRYQAALREMRDARAQHGFQHGDSAQVLAISQEIWATSRKLPVENNGERKSILGKAAYFQGVSLFYSDELQRAGDWFREAGELDPKEYPSKDIDAWFLRIKEGGPGKAPVHYQDSKRSLKSVKDQKNSKARIAKR